ncbi:hypothetical protein ACFL6P_07905 [Candidatus Latescibacterota bacterium]
MKTRGLRLRGTKWWIRFSDGCGNMIEESSQSKRKSDATAILEKRRVQVREGKLGEVRKIPKLTFNEITVEFLGWAKGRHKSFDRTEGFVKQLINDFGNLSLNRFSNKLIESWQSIRQRLCLC